MRLPRRTLLPSTLLLFSLSWGWLAVAGVATVVTGCAKKEEEVEKDDSAAKSDDEQAGTDDNLTTDLMPPADETLTTEMPQGTTLTTE